MPCFSARSEPWLYRLSDAVDHHVERDLGLADPAHAVREACRAETGLTEQMALPAPAEHLVLVHAQVGDPDLAVVVAARQRLDVAYDLPALGRDVDDERRVGGLRQVGVVLGPRDQDREVGAARARR